MLRKWLLTGLLVVAAQGFVRSQERPASNKSRGKAVLLSFLIPGMGELYLDNWNYKAWQTGRYFAGAEAALWLGHGYLGSYSGWVREDSRSLAARYAGVDLKSGKPSQYYVRIGKYKDIYSYNEEQRRLSGTSDLYTENQKNYWSWDNDGHRLRYDRLRTRSRRYERVSNYLYFGIFVNHVLSAIHASRYYHRLEKLSGYDLHLEFDPQPVGSFGGPGMKAVLTKSF